MIDYLQNLRNTISDILQTHDVIIAGGAVYDTLDEKGPPKDIDIFVNTPGSPTLRGYAHKITQDGTLLGEVNPLPEDAGYRNNFNYALIGVVNLTTPTALKVQLIGLNLHEFNMQNLLQTFDYNICKAGLDRYGIIEDELRTEDLDCGTITLEKLRPDTLVSAGKRLKRLLDKYPDFDPVFGFTCNPYQRESLFQPTPSPVLDFNNIRVARQIEEAF